METENRQLIFLKRVNYRRATLRPAVFADLAQDFLERGRTVKLLRIS